LLVIFKGKVNTVP